MLIGQTRVRRRGAGITTVATTVGWVVFAGAGVAGLRLQYEQAKARDKEPLPVIAEKMDVRMISAAASPPSQADPALQAPPVIEANPPPLPSVPSEVVEAPSAATPFAVPVNAPVTPKSIAAPAVEQLTLGIGEGDKPPPDYPAEARLAHQQGTVKVQFTVNESGQVVDVKAISPSPYPLLNDAAVRAVRETWNNFPPGKVRLLNISFVFQLHQK